MEESKNQSPAMHTQEPISKVKSDKIYTRSAIALLIFILLFGVLYSSKQSLPGDRLYTLKIDVLEKMQTAIHISTKSKALYQVTLLTNRLDEVRELNKSDSVTKEMEEIFSTQLSKESATLTTLIAQSTDGAFPKIEVLSTINNFASVAGAIEAISEQNVKLVTIGDTAENIRIETVRLYKDKSLSFVQTENQEAVYAFIATQLKEVKDELGNNELSVETSRIAKTYLDRVEPALKDADLTKVIVSIAEAQRFIRIEQYAGAETAAPQKEAAISTTTSTQASSTVAQ